MKKFRMIAFLGLICVVAFTGFAFATSATDPYATQTVTFQVKEIDAISTSGNPKALIIDSAVAGSDLTSVTDNSTTYSITTNGICKKITGSLNNDMPANTYLYINLDAPNGANSKKDVQLKHMDTTLVDNINRVAAQKAITYTFKASVAAGVIDNQVRTVTLTVID